MPAFISICIPAYKRTEFLQRLLDSIAIQTFRNFEVIVTDDSPDDSVSELCKKYEQQFPLRYHRNEKAAGTPANWNIAIGLARGEWIKLVHDDDWFFDAGSLQAFADAIAAHPATDFFYCAYRNVYLESGKHENIFISSYRKKQLDANPVTLWSKNVIGPPSVILHRKKNVAYDVQLKWLVDIDFYMRYLNGSAPVYIDRQLMNVGLGQHQVTQDCFGKRVVEIPENFHVLNKTGEGQLRHPLVYDAWWRLMRNLEITKVQEIREAGYEGAIHPVIVSMINLQKKIPRSLLTTGFISKSCMFVHYLLHRNKLPLE